MDERSMALDRATINKMMGQKPIQASSVHHVGDMYIHKKHKFIIKIVGRGEWSGHRMCEVVKGEVPKIVQQRAKYEAGWEDHEEGGYYPATIEYSTCALTNCFTRLKAAKVLFG